MLWIDLVQNVCLAVFAADFVLHLALVEKPRRYLFSFTGLIDASAVLFFFVPQVRSELLCGCSSSAASCGCSSLSLIHI